jgi:hypothetical protein
MVIELATQHGPVWINPAQVAFIRPTATGSEIVLSTGDVFASGRSPDELNTLLSGGAPSLRGNVKVVDR